MSNTVIGLYNDSDTAERVIEDLTSSGFNRSRVEMHRESDASGLKDELTGEGIPEDDADYYVKGLRDGGILVSVNAEDDKTDDAVEIMNRYANEGGYEDGREFDGDANLDANRTRSADEGDIDMAVAEEQLRVGKRSVQRGGVRVRSRVVEEDVSEDVTLRDETVRVDRRPVDRTVSDNDHNVFKEETVEFTETDEEAVVDKETRVTEEIHVGKDVEERTETVSDTVRHTEVDVDEIDGKRERNKN